MNKYRAMKLGQILATVGCKAVPNGSVIDITKDGTVVMSGSIDEIRERVAFNCHHHDDPIYYGRSRLSGCDNGKTPATQAKIIAAGQLINAAIDAELPELADDKESLVDGAGGSVGREGKKVRQVFSALQEMYHTSGTAGSATLRDGPDSATKPMPRACMAETPSSGAGYGKKARYILPANRVGALQEMYHSEHRSYHTGVIPRYEFKDTGNAPVPPGGHHHCSVRLGELLRWGKGPTKKLAKQDAAGVMLLDIMHGKKPFKKEGQSPGGHEKKKIASGDQEKYCHESSTWDGKDPFVTKKKKDSIPDDWEGSYLRKHHAALSYPTNLPSFRYNRDADGWLLRKPKKVKYVLKPKTN